MHLTYQLRETDMAAYARYIATRPGKVRALLRRNDALFGITYTIGIIVALLFVVHIRLTTTLVTALVTAVPLYFLYRTIALSQYVSRVIKLSSSGDSFQVRNCTLDLAEDGLHSSSELGTSTIFWASIQGIEETPDYIFLFLQGINAAIIPKRAFTVDTNLQEFRTIVNRYLQLSGGAPPVLSS